MRKWKSSLSSSAAIAAAMAEANIAAPRSRAGSAAGNGYGGEYRLTPTNDSAPSGLLLALMSIGNSALCVSGGVAPSALAGDNEGGATAAAAAVIDLLSTAGSRTEDAEVQRSLLEMLVGRRTQSPVSEDLIWKVTLRVLGRSGTRTPVRWLPHLP